MLKRVNPQHTCNVTEKMKATLRKPTLQEMSEFRRRYIRNESLKEEEKNVGLISILQDVYNKIVGTKG